MLMSKKNNVAIYQNLWAIRIRKKYTINRSRIAVKIFDRTWKCVRKKSHFFFALHIFQLLAQIIYIIILRNFGRSYAVLKCRAVMKNNVIDGTITHAKHVGSSVIVPSLAQFFTTARMQKKLGSSPFYPQKSLCQNPNNLGERHLMRQQGGGKQISYRGLQ